MHNSFDDVLRSYFCQLFILLLIQLSDTSCNWRSGRLASSNNHQLGVFFRDLNPLIRQMDTLPLFLFLRDHFKVFLLPIF